MRTDGHTGVARKANGAPHDGRVARVRAAGHVGGGDVRHHRFVGSHPPGPKRFAEIAVEVDWHEVEPRKRMLSPDLV
jgi:hypothetical protein